jgi:thiol-disulfide isomerase/thioredoxin
VEITLSRGHNFPIRVVDGHGKPVPGAVVRPGRQLKMAQETYEAGAGWSGVTATDGCATWSNAPDGELIWRVAAPGFRRQEFTFAPESGNHTVTLLRPQHISGEVVEAGTGKKVDEFQVIVGSVEPSGRLYWPLERSAQTGSHGLFDLTQEAWATPKRLLILSPHHLPLMSGVIPAAADEITTRVTLVPGVPGVGRVLDPAGSPVSSASLCLLTPWSRASDEGNGPNVYGAYQIFHTSSDGSFTLPPQDSPFTVAVWSDAGYAEKQFASTSAPLDLRVAPWAVVEGELPEFEPGELVQARRISPSAVLAIPTTAVDGRGRFTFPQLPPGVWSIHAGTTKSLPYYRFRFDVRTSLDPGAHETLRFGDGSGVVAGSVDLKTTDGQIADVPSGAAVLTAYDRTRVYRTPVAKDGTFRFKGVPGGRYSISILSNTLKPELERRRLAFRVKDLVVPEDAGTSVSKVEVGRLELVPARLIAAGLPATEITTISPEGREIRLSDFRGRWVVVDFWGPYCGACIRAMRDTLKPMWKRYRDSGRLVIYSVALTTERATCMNLIKERNFDWVHGFSQGGFEEAVSSYQIKGVPALYLIDPQGVVVAADVEEDELVKKVAELVK